MLLFDLAAEPRRQIEVQGVGSAKARIRQGSLVSCRRLLRRLRLVLRELLVYIVWQLLCLCQGPRRWIHEPFDIRWRCIAEIILRQVRDDQLPLLLDSLELGLQPLLSSQLAGWDIVETSGHWPGFLSNSGVIVKGRMAGLTAHPIRSLLRVELGRLGAILVLQLFVASALEVICRSGDASLGSQKHHGDVPFLRLALSILAHVLLDLQAADGSDGHPLSVLRLV